MNLEHQVAPLELAREMKALGFPQETLFVWGVWNGQASIAVCGTETRQDPPASFAEELDVDNPITDFDCAAPTVAEMGEWLPSVVSKSTPEADFQYRICIDKDATGWAANYQNTEQRAGKTSDADREIGRWTRSATEAEARARLLIALAKAGAIDVKELR